ncbi:NitT/TauT family transport system ATP-binding protein [Bacillus niacini]|uniref:NitT/TauT family transport system ATP-binding protein n=1 Tax=Neobacillus niacini TaxID=86668 RepID=A0A852TLG1_9BACI|nr:ABC transporter ATP-binding protein [Neobacillus niacini]NYE08546.1 NitT/TauT family transport system ATP-binding protein [Neobacillus niacini]
MIDNVMGTAATLQNLKLSTRFLDVTYVNNKTGAEVMALENINLDIKDGEFICIVGPSGCGKTTFLNTVVGLLKPSRGEILLDQKKIEGPGNDRAMVFQNPSLLPWRTVLDNVLYGVELQKQLSADKKQEAKEFIEMVGLKGYENHYPHELSGGMQQRVNLARALTVNPSLLLLDEPFSALDAQTREFMQGELLRIWSETKKTSLFITHQIDEAVFLADRVFVFGARPGRVVEVIDVNIPRPRDLHVKRSPEFVHLVDHIWSIIEKESSKQGFDNKGK